MFLINENQIRGEIQCDNGYYTIAIILDYDEDERGRWKPMTIIYNIGIGTFDQDTGLYHRANKMYTDSTIASAPAKVREACRKLISSLASVFPSIRKTLK